MCDLSLWPLQSARHFNAYLLLNDCFYSPFKIAQWPRWRFRRIYRKSRKPASQQKSGKGNLRLSLVTWTTTQCSDFCSALAVIFSPKQRQVRVFLLSVFVILYPELISVKVNEAVIVLKSPQFVFIMLTNLKQTCSPGTLVNKYESMSKKIQNVSNLQSHAWSFRMILGSHTGV